MKKTTKLLSFLLALTLIIGVMVIAPVMASALDNGTFQYRVLTDNTVEITGFVDPEYDSMTLSIPDKIDSKIVSGIAENAFATENHLSLEEVKLPAQLKYIGAKAFYGVHFFDYLRIPESVTSIGDQAFGFGPTDDIYVWTVTGKAGSQAQAYCAANGFKFISEEKLNHPEYRSRVVLRETAQDDPLLEDRTIYNVLRELELGETPQGVSFDIDTFTLTLNNVDLPNYELMFSRENGKEITISVNGENSLGNIIVSTGVDAPKLKIVGNGALTVNANKWRDNAISLQQFLGVEKNATNPSLLFGESVVLKLYGKKSPVMIRAAGMFEQLEQSPVRTTVGWEIESEAKRDSYEDPVTVDGCISEEYVPGSQYKLFVGDMVTNDNDPDGLYVSIYDDDFNNKVYRYYYDEAHDVHVCNYAVAPVDFNSEIHHYQHNAYGDWGYLYTRRYYTDNYEKVRAKDGKLYLVASYIMEDNSNCVSFTCTAYSYEMLDENVLSADMTPYAVLGEKTTAEFSGGQSDEGEALSEGAVKGILFVDDSELGYLANRKVDDGFVYTYSFWNDGDEDNYSIRKFSYNEELDLYTERDEEHYDLNFMTEAEFLEEFTPVMDNENNRVVLKKSKAYQTLWNLHVYKDTNGKQYACKISYDEGAEKEKFDAVYTMTKLAVPYDEGIEYLLVPAEDVDTETLTEEINTVVTNRYIYTLPGTEFFYNVPEQIQTIDALDVGNVWTHPLISGNPGCQPCYVPFTAEVNPDIEGAYVYDEIWTNTKDGSTSSKLNQQAVKPGYAYNYTMVVKAQPGYRFNENLAFTYLREAAPGATLTFSADKKTLTVTGLETVNFLLDTPALGTVANTYNGVKFTWKTVKGAVKFRVFRKYGNTGWTKIADTTATSYEDKKVSSGVKYTYTVRCVSADGKVLTSGFNTVGKAITYVAAPRITKFENVNSGTKITWSASKGATYYRVMYKKNNTWTKLADVKGTSYIATKMASGTKRYYTVRAMNASKQFVSAYNTTGWPATFIAAPALPKLVNTKNGVQVSYTKPKGSTYVRVMRKTAKGKWVKIADTAGTKIVDKTAKKGVKYFYTVRCIAKGGKSFQSGYNATGRAIVCKR